MEKMEKTMTNFYDAIYLSPHLDDMALSCSGQVWQKRCAGNTILVVTLFTGDPPPPPYSDFADLLHSRWGHAQTVMAVRREEDARSCALLGVDYLHWGLPDAIYRRDHAGNFAYPTWQDITTTFHPSDEAVIAGIVQRLATLPPATQLFAPLTVGQHIDHRLTRLAVERWAKQPLLYYEDYPYAARSGALEAVIEDGADWESLVVPLSAEDLAVKYAAIAAHHSQFSSFFVDDADLQAKVGGYAGTVGGERLWRKK